MNSHTLVYQTFPAGTHLVRSVGTFTTHVFIFDDGDIMEIDMLDEHNAELTLDQKVAAVQVLSGSRVMGVAVL